MKRYVIKYRKSFSRGSASSAVLGYLPILFVVFVSYKIFGKFSDLFGNSSGEENSEDMVGSVKVNTSKMSFPFAHAYQLAGKLYQAMNPHSSFSPVYDGTDEETIIDVFSEIKTADDMRAVYKAFGVRDYRFVMVTDMLDLNAWLEAELSGTLLSTIKIKLSWI